MGISLTQLVNTVIDIKNYIDNKINEIDNNTISISSQENNAIINKEDGIYVENKTQTIQNLNTKINNISFTQKTTNTKLNSAYCKLEKDYTPVVNAIVPFVKESGNIFVNNGKIIIEPGKRVQINVCLSFIGASSSQKLVNVKFAIYDITNNIRISLLGTYDNEAMYQYNKSLCCQYENTTDTNCEIGLKIIEIYENCSVAASYSDLTIQEIGRQIIIDPVQYINETNGLEDTPVGHIMSYLSNTAPKHYLLCDGSEYNIQEYSWLAQHFLDEYGTLDCFGGDGINTFKVPNLESYTQISNSSNSDISNVDLSNCIEIEEWNNLKIIDSKYVINESGVFSTLSGRTYNKINKGLCIAVTLYIGSKYSIPVLISPIEEATYCYCSYNPSYICNKPYASVEYNNITWYITPCEYAFTDGLHGTNYPTLTIDWSYNINDYATAALIVLETLLKNFITYKIQTYIKYEPTFYSVINKTPSQEEIELLEEQNNLLKQQISQLETILDSINNEVI